MNQSTPTTEWGTIRRFASYALTYKTRLVYAFLCSGFIAILMALRTALLLPALNTIFGQTDSAATNLVQPNQVEFLAWVTAPIEVMIDFFAQDNKFLALGVLCFCVLVIMVLLGVCRYIQEYMVKWVGNYVILDLQNELFEKLIHYRASYFSDNRVGALISYFTADARVIGIAVFSVFARMMLDPLLLIVTLVFLFMIEWKLTLIYAIVFPFIILTIRYFAKKNRRAGKETQDITATMGAFLQENFSHIRLVQGYGMYGRQKERLYTEARGVFNASMRMVRAMATASPINEFLGICGLTLVLMIGGYLIFEIDDPTLNPSEFITYIVFLMTIYQPVKRLERSVQQVQHGIAACDRVFEALDTNAELPEKPNAPKVNSLERSIEFDAVSFAYEGDTEVLSDLSLVVNKGEQVAFVGPSGAGKSTLVNLIPRFYDPTAGSIQLDGEDLREVDLFSLRKMISFVHQDVMIFGDTVKENMVCGDYSYSDEQIESAAKAAHAHEFIAQLQQGYDTPLGERGESLSGGQCQRLALARAFLRDAPILILDEATSSLDSESERKIKESLNHLMQGRTTLVIAHRLSTILQADKIAVMDQGKIIDIGPHQELLQRCSLYQRLYKLQFEDLSNKPESMI